VKKTRDYKANLERAERGPGYHQDQSVMLDMPYLEDVFTQDLTAGADKRNAVKQGWQPTFSRFTTHMTPNQTRPAVKKQAEEMDAGYDDQPTDSGDWRETIIFGAKYR
jgi:uncharacterized protein (DUF1501 family)